MHDQSPSRNARCGHRAGLPTRVDPRLARAEGKAQQEVILPNIKRSIRDLGEFAPRAHDVRIFTPHTTTKVSIVTDANSNALSMEANLITPPFASYPGYNVR